MEQMYLVEIFIDKVTIFTTEDDVSSANKNLIIKVNFGPKIQFIIKEGQLAVNDEKKDDIIECDKTGRRQWTRIIRVGKSFLFPSYPDTLLMILAKFPLEIAVWNDDENEVNIFVGVGSMHWDTQFFLMLKETADACKIHQPLSIKTKATLWAECCCVQAGEVTFILRLSALGNSIVTEFQQLLKDPDSFVFRTNKAPSMFQCKRVEGDDPNFCMVGSIYETTTLEDPDILDAAQKKIEICTELQSCGVKGQNAKYVCEHGSGNAPPKKKYPVDKIRMGDIKGPCGNTNCVLAHKVRTYIRNLESYKGKVQEAGGITEQKPRSKKTCGTCSCKDDRWHREDCPEGMKDDNPDIFSKSRCEGCGGFTKSGDTCADRTGKLFGTGVTPKGSRSQSPKGSEAQSPKGTVTQSPKGSAMQSPKSNDTQSPKGNVTQSPKSSKTQSPKGQAAQSPKGSETQSPNKGSKSHTPKGSETQVTYCFNVPNFKGAIYGQNYVVENCINTNCNSRPDLTLKLPSVQDVYTVGCSCRKGVLSKTTCHTTESNVTIFSKNINNQIVYNVETNPKVYNIGTQSTGACSIGTNVGSKMEPKEGKPNTQIFNACMELSEEKDCKCSPVKPSPPCKTFDCDCMTETANIASRKMHRPYCPSYKHKNNCPVTMLHEEEEAGIKKPEDDEDEVTPLPYGLPPIQLGPCPILGRPCSVPDGFARMYRNAQLPTLPPNYSDAGKICCSKEFDRIKKAMKDYMKYEKDHDFRCINKFTVDTERRCCDKEQILKSLIGKGCCGSHKMAIQDKYKEEKQP